MNDINDNDSLGDIILRSNSQMVENVTECLKNTIAQQASSRNEQVTKMTGAIEDLKEHLSQETLKAYIHHIQIILTVLITM